MANLIIIRGLPGSGKSTIARAFETRSDITDPIHFEADMYFLQDGVYKFDANLLHKAHEWCLQSCAFNLKIGRDVIVSNTFTTIKELRPYFKMAKELGIVPNVILAQNSFRNIHNVPAETLQKMKDRFVYDISELFNEV